MTYQDDEEPDDEEIGGEGEDVGIAPFNKR